jgi:K+-sensing histidine kinase KdpD
VSHAIGEPAAIVEPHATVEPDATVESATPGPHATVSAPPPSPTSGDDPKLEVLLGELAHELRNPMVTVKTFAQHLDSVLADPESRARFAALTGDAITRMDTLLETLLDFSRFRAPERRPVDLSALLARALAERSDELARRNVHVDAPQNGSGAVVVEADESQVSFALRSLVDGLVGDLISHTPVRVRASADGTLELAVHADRAIAARLAAYVADDAAGGAHPPLAFALATALIRRNRGTLDVRSAADGAMIISVSLPRPARQDSER